MHRPAAVLVPVVARREAATVLLTQRAAHLRDHSGQIAFPGGKIDADDASPLAAALREAEEEIGLDRGFVRPLGYLEPYVTTSGFRIVPVVSLVDPGYALTINPREVDGAFEVPLSFLMTPANHETHQREWKGHMRRYYTPCPMASATSGASPQASCGACTRGSTRDARHHRGSPPLPDSLRAVRAVVVGAPALPVPAHALGRSHILAAARRMALAFASLVYTGLTAPRGMGPYVPAHMENGKFVPARIE